MGLDICQCLTPCLSSYHSMKKWVSTFPNESSIYTPTLITLYIALIVVQGLQRFFNMTFILGSEPGVQSLWKGNKVFMLWLVVYAYTMPYYRIIQPCNGTFYHLRWIDKSLKRHNRTRTWYTTTSNKVCGMQRKSVPLVLYLLWRVGHAVIGKCCNIVKICSHTIS